MTRYAPASIRALARSVPPEFALYAIADTLRVRLDQARRLAAAAGVPTRRRELPRIE